MDVNHGIRPHFIALGIILVCMVTTTGCIHTGTARNLLFPGDEPPIEFERGTIAEVRHNFTGAFTETTISFGAEERHLGVDNFYIGKGGADLYIWAQVHFGADTSGVVDFPRYVHVRLIYEPGSQEEAVVSESLYSPQGNSRYDKAELMDTLNGTKEGLYSLKVESVGTATQEGEVMIFDWYLFTVNGVYSDRSYNNNAPGRF